MILNKKNIRIFGVVIIIAVLLYFAVLIISSRSTNVDENSAGVTVYFLNPTTNTLEGESRTIPIAENAAMAESVLGLIYGGPKSANLTKTATENVKFLDGQLKDNVLEAEFSSEYNNMSAAQELLFRASFVWSMTDIDFIDYVHFYVDGMELLNSRGQPIGLMDRYNIVLNPKITPVKQETHVAALYFRDAENKSLIREERSIVINLDQPIEKYIVEQLIAGPSNNSSYPVMPVETKVREARTDAGICYLNLSNEFITKYNGNVAAAKLTVYSIVNSLTELTEVNKVQIFIESNRVTDFLGSVDLSKPFERDDTLIIK